MLFVTHLLVAGLLARRAGVPVAWAVVGPALPDLVDKPLAAVGVVALFPSVCHSALLAVLILPAARLGTAGAAAAARWARERWPGGPGRAFGPCRAVGGGVVQERAGGTAVVAAAFRIRIVSPAESTTAVVTARAVPTPRDDDPG